MFHLPNFGKRLQPNIMYDTVNFWLDKGDMAGADPLAVSLYLDEVTEHYSDKWGYSCSGKCGDYAVSCSRRGLSLKGSLAKFYLPSNVYTLTRQTAAEAISKLGDDLHTDITAARVTRLDVSTVITTQRPPADYYPALGYKYKFKRDVWANDTLYYTQQQRQLVFYDKTKEAGAKSAVIPPSFIGSNLLRYELRYTNKIQQQLRQAAPITAATLTDGGFYHFVIQRWKSEFDTIKKIHRMTVETDNIKTPKDAKIALFSMLLQGQEDGQSIVDEYISDLRASRVFSDPKAYSRLKADLNKILQAADVSKGDLISEIEKAIADVAMYAR